MMLMLILMMMTMMMITVTVRVPMTLLLMGGGGIYKDKNTNRKCTDIHAMPQHSLTYSPTQSTDRRALTNELYY